MCLESVSSEFKVTQDLEVYKVLLNNNKPPFARNHGKPDFVYESHKTYRLGKKLRLVSGEVDAGFHAFMDLRYAREEKTYHSKSKIVRMLIPRGASCRLGTNSHIVTTKILSCSLNPIR